MGGYNGYGKETPTFQFQSVPIIPFSTSLEYFGHVYRLTNEAGQNWENAGDISKRNRHTCTHITTSAGEDQVIVVGGLNSGALHTSSVEIYTPETEGTRAGNDG